MKILISGFEAFDGLESNPSEDLILELAKKKWDFMLYPVVLPVSFKKAFRKLKKEIDKLRPDIVICVGLAYIRNEITLERVAINFAEARIPDNDGFQPVGEFIVAQAPDGLFSDLPINSMAQVCIDNKIKASISNTAGTYVCNALMYEVLLYGRSKKFKAGFIHIPPTSDIKKEKGTVEMDELIQAFHLMLNGLAKENLVSSTSNHGKEC